MLWEMRVSSITSMQARDTPCLHSVAAIRTFGGQTAAAPEDGAVEEADEQRHEHAHEVVGRAAPVRQPELAR
jgi:hypothetical protein